MRWRLVGWAAASIGIAFAIAEAVLLNVRIRDFDEGVYWQSIRALARGEPLFSSVFASQPPGFYGLLLPLYFVGQSLLSLRLTVLIFGLVGLAATYLAGRLLAGPIGALMATVLVATSPLYFHQSAIIQADGPSVALSAVAVCLALLAVRRSGGSAIGLAMLAGVALAAAVGIKFVSAVTVVPVAMVLLGESGRRWRLLAGAVAAGLVGLVAIFLPAIAAPGAAYTQLVTEHLRASQVAHQGFAESLSILFLRREQPLEALALLAAIITTIRRDREAVMPIAWSLVSIAAALVYHPVFPHHLVMLSLPLALVVAVGFSPPPRPSPQRGERVRSASVEKFALAALVLATAGAGAVAIGGEIQLALVPDLHDDEMAAAVRSVSKPGDFWISDNPWAVAAADRDLPGPMVDAASQRIRTGLLTVDELEQTRVAYHVRWVLEDSFRLDKVPGYQNWLDAHFRVGRRLGGDAVIYEAKAP